MKAARRPASGGERGSVLMEYMVMSCVIASALVVFWHSELYDFETGWKDGNLKIGRTTVDFYQRVLGGIAMPIP